LVVGGKMPALTEHEISRTLVLNLSGKARGASAQHRIFLPLTASSALQELRRGALLRKDGDNGWAPSQNAIG